MKFLLVFSLVLLVLGIKILFDLRNEVTYRQESQKVKNFDRPNPQKVDNPLEYLFCLPLKGELDLLPNRTQIDIENLAEDLPEYFRSEQFIEATERWLERTSNSFPFWKSTLSELYTPLARGDYYLFNEKICVKSVNAVNKLAKLFRDSSLFAFQRQTYDLYQLSVGNKQNYQLLNQAILLNEQHPNLNCNQGNSRFDCLNECFKKGRRLPRYFYDGNETGPIQLNYNDEDESVKQQEALCLRNCAANCKATYFSYSNSEDETEVRKFIAQPFITRFDFWLWLAALLSSFIALSLCQCSPKSINRTIFRRVLLLTCLVSALILSYILYQVHYAPVDPINEQGKTQTKEIAFELLEPQSFKLTCCIGLDSILPKDPNEGSSLYAYNRHHYERSRYSLIYENKTLAQLERETDKTVADAVQDIYLKFLNKRQEVAWTLSPRVLFLLYREGLLHRCFELVVRPKEPVYQSQLSATRLVLNLNRRPSLVSVEPVNVRSNADNSDFEGGLLQKAYRTVERKLSEEEGNCIDYAAIYPNCDSRQNCLEVCVNQQLLNTSGHIASYYMIYKDQLTERQWSDIPIQGNTHPHSLTRKMRRFCEEKFGKDTSKEDCSWTVYERNKYPDDQPFSEKEIILPYSLRKEFEERKPTSSLPLDLLFIQGVFLALNMLRLVSVVGMLKFEVRKIELLHLLIYALCLLALLTYIVYTFWAAMNEKLTYQQYFESPKSIQMPDAVVCFERLNVTELPPEDDSSEEIRNEEIANHNETVNDLKNYNETVKDLNSNETANDSEITNHNETMNDVYSEVNSTSYQAPFSWQDEYELSTDFEDGELTVGRLEELWADLTPETVFEKIIYLHKASNEWVTLNSTSNFTNDDLSVSHFFLRGNKCFSVNNRGLDYDRFVFLQSQNIDVLKMQFRNTFKKQLNRYPRKLIFSFGTKKRSKMEFHKMFNDLYLSPDASFVINQRSVKMTIKNHFAWMNPFAFLTEDRDELDDYLSKLRSAFIKQYNLSTLSLPLEMGDPNQMHLKISNATLFEQFYEEFVRENGAPVDSEREFAANELVSQFTRFAVEQDYDLKVSLTFAKQIIEQTNADAYLQLLLHLANALIVLIVFALFDRCICKLSK